MPARLDGRHPNTLRPALGVLADEDGKPIPLPPLSELHADGLPGGSLHREVTEDEAGFMAPRHLQALEDAVSRPVLDPGAYSPVNHRHVSLETATAALGSLQERLVAVSEQLASLAEQTKGHSLTINSIANRAVFNPDAFAAVSHDHPPHPLPAHGHPEISIEVEAAKEEVETTRGAIAALTRPLTELGTLVAKLQKDLEFTRDLAEKAIEQPPREQHGHLKGGRLHEACSERLAGFMTPQMLRMLQILWDERGED